MGLFGFGKKSNVHNSATDIGIELVKALATEMRSMGIEWSTAYVRFEASESKSEWKGSYTTQLFDVFQHKGLIKKFQILAPELQRKLAASSKTGKKFCVFLLVLESSMDYEFKYEYEDKSHWKISKLNGASGVPEGL
jgi:hypothetical protein